MTVIRRRLKFGLGSVDFLLSSAFLYFRDLGRVLRAVLLFLNALAMLDFIVRK